MVYVDNNIGNTEANDYGVLVKLTATATLKTAVRIPIKE